MKTLLIFSFLSLISLASLAPPCERSKSNIVPIDSTSKADSTELNAFLEKLAFEETRDSTWYPWKGFKTPWVVVNHKGAAGRWQILISTLRYLGYKGTIRDFLNSKEIQREYVIKVMKKNKEHIELYIPHYKIYLGKYRFGVKITIPGMLAASHLGGVGSLRWFLKNGYNASDGNRTIKDYLFLFKDLNEFSI